MKEVPWGPNRSQRIRKSVIYGDQEVNVKKEIQIEGDSTSFEEAIRGVHSSKWQEAKEDKMKSINSNDV
jgi:hypothetical protein